MHAPARRYFLGLQDRSELCIELARQHRDDEGVGTRAIQHALSGNLPDSFHPRRRIRARIIKLEHAGTSARRRRIHACACQTVASGAAEYRRRRSIADEVAAPYVDAADLSRGTARGNM